MINFLDFLKIVKKQNKLFESKLLVETSLNNMMDNFQVSKQDLIILGPYDLKDKNGKIKHYNEVLFHYTDKNDKFNNIMNQGLIANAGSQMKLSEKGIYLSNTPIGPADTYSTRLRGENSETRLLVIDASKIDKNKLDFDTVEFFRKHKEQDKDQKDRYYTKFDIKTGLLNYDYDDNTLYPPKRKKDDKSPNYRLKLASFFTRFIFNASYVYRNNNIPTDAIIDVYGPGWTSSTKNNNKGVDNIYNLYTKKSNGNKYFLKKYLSKNIQIKLYNLIKLYFSTLKNKYDDVTKVSPEVIEKNKNIYITSTKNLIAKSNNLKTNEDYINVNNDLNNYLDELFNTLTNLGNLSQLEIRDKLANNLDIDKIKILSNNESLINKIFNKVGINLTQMFKDYDIGPIIRNYFKTVFNVKYLNDKNNKLLSIINKINQNINNIRKQVYDFYEYSYNEYKFNYDKPLNIDDIFQNFEDSLFEYQYYFEDVDQLKEDIKVCLSTVKNMIDKKANEDLESKSKNKVFYTKVFNTKGGYNKIINLINDIIENL